MNIRKEFNTIILPILKGLPLIILLAVIAFMVTKQLLKYTNSIYQADGAILIDLSKKNTNTNVIFDEQGGKKSSHSFLTEVESFKAKSLIEKTLRTLNFDVSYFRIGELRKTELYLDAPFSIHYASTTEDAFDRPFYLRYLGNDQFQISKVETFDKIIDTIRFGQLYIDEHLAMTVNRNEKVLKEKPNSLRTNDVFQFQLNSIEALMAEINSSNLFIKPIDKEIQVIKVYYQHEIAEKAKLFVDALMETYIKSCQEVVSSESETTLVFLETKLAEITKKLKDAESKLAGYKAENGIINAMQETDAALKEIMQLDLQKVNYELQEDELTKLFEFLATGNNLQAFAPNFESLKDPVFRDAYLKAQKYELDKLDLESKYTAESKQIIKINRKINNLRTFVHESVQAMLEKIVQRREKLEQNIAEKNESIQTIPNKERQIVALEREVKLNEGLYNLMSEKRMEIAISKTATVVGHQIIDPARIGKSPVWPNKGLMYGVSIFFALLVGILLSFIGNFLFATVKSKEDLNELMEIPVIGTIAKVKKKSKNNLDAFGNLYTNIEVLGHKKTSKNKGKVIAVASFLPNEGKTFTTVNLAKSFASVGKRVLVIDMDTMRPDVHHHFNMHNDAVGLGAIITKEMEPVNVIKSSGYENLDVIFAGNLENIFSAIIFAPDSLTYIENLKKHYDYILIDTLPLNLIVDAVPLMHQTDINLIIVRSGFSKIRKIKMVQPLLDEFKIPNAYTVLNAVKPKANKYYSKKRKFVKEKEEIRTP